MIKKIITPSDFEETIGSDLYMKELLFKPNPDFEPLLRNILDRIFKNLELMDKTDYSLLSAYLDSIEEPLRELREMRFQIVAIDSQDYCHFGEKTIPMSNIIYFIAPDPCYFKIDSIPKSKVHKLGVECEDAIKDLRNAIDQKFKIHYWYSKDYLEKFFEKEIPLCNICWVNIV
jgi:hypothetical protein